MTLNVVEKELFIRLLADSLGKDVDNPENQFKISVLQKIIVGR